MPEPEFVEMPESFCVNLYRTHGVKAANVGNVGENVGNVGENAGETTDKEVLAWERRMTLLPQI